MRGLQHFGIADTAATSLAAFIVPVAGKYEEFLSIVGSYQRERWTPVHVTAALALVAVARRAYAELELKAQRVADDLAMVYLQNGRRVACDVFEYNAFHNHHPPFF